MKKLILFVSIVLVLIASTASADVLGSPSGGWVTDMGANTYLHGTTFISENKDIGAQAEYYAEYTPNSEVIPVVVNGESLWGTRTITQAISYMKNNGLKPLIGINADYFSFKTGIPMGTSVMDGEIATSASGYIDAVGFRSDGTAFVRGLNLKTTLYHGLETANVECINKWYTKDYTPIAIITDKFGSSTKTSSDCLFLICTPVEGRLAIGQTFTVRVDEKFESDREIAIPDGKIILLINKTGYESDYRFLNSIDEGEVLSIVNTAVDDSENIWTTAYNAIGTSAGRLIKNGTIGSGFEPGTAPRTAVGVKPNGNIIFYVLDGRQKGHSYGASSDTIARRLYELGCVDALNLDGGGSTAMAGVFPGSDEAMVINKPSDGSLRACANYLFLRDNRKPTGIPAYVVTDNFENKNFISGTSTKFNIVSVYDTGNYKMENFDNLEITAENHGGSKSYIDTDYVIHFEGSGETVINVISDGRIICSEQYAVFDTPDDIKIYNQSTWKEISEIYCTEDGSYTIDLSASPVINGYEINTQDYAYEWSVTGGVGTIDEGGFFTAAPGLGKAGKIYVKKGEFTKEINVYLPGYSNETESGFEDISGHWASDTILLMAEEGILNGYNENGRKVFKPDEYMTRAEFAKIVCVSEGLDISDYNNTNLKFIDSDEIPLWAQNYVKAAYGTGVISGRSNADGTYSFAPYDNITRAEAMTILGRLVDDAEAILPDFADSKEIPEWAREGIGKLLSKGIIQGYSNNTILPNNNIKRAEAAVLLKNFGY